MKKKIYITVVCILVAFFLTACGGPKEVSNEIYTVEIGDEILQGTYTGTVIDDLPNGLGSFIYSNDDKKIEYTGAWEQGKASGEGVLDYHGFTVKYGPNEFTGRYTGDALDGVVHGEGKFSYEKRDDYFDYTGQWEHGYIYGNGNLEYSSLELQYNGKTLYGKYAGEVENGVPCGAGTFEWASRNDYLVYSGTWVNGMLSGEGNLETNQYSYETSAGIIRIGTYTGEVLDGIACGEGSFSSYNDSNIQYTYSGQWKNNQWHGQGTCKWDDQNSYIERGTYTDNTFTPTPLEYFIAKGTRSVSSYGISDTAQKYLLEHPDMFMENDIIEGAEFEENFTYREYTKNQSIYGSKLISVSNLCVLQIEEAEYWGAKHSFCIAYDSQINYYWIDMFGYTEDVYEGSYITLKALPLDYFSYENIEGGYTYAIACAGVRIE